MKNTYIKPDIDNLTLFSSKELCVDIPISGETTPEESETNKGLFEEDTYVLPTGGKVVNPWKDDE